MNNDVVSCLLQQRSPKIVSKYEDKIKQSDPFHPYNSKPCWSQRLPIDSTDRIWYSIFISVGINIWFYGSKRAHFQPNSNVWRLGWKLIVMIWINNIKKSLLKLFILFTSNILILGMFGSKTAHFYSFMSSYGWYNEKKSILKRNEYIPNPQKQDLLHFCEKFCEKLYF